MKNYNVYFFLLISEATAQRWLKKMGFEFKKFTKSVYVDGHEREDVIKYRKKFLKEMEM
jgi:hypothetical protein